MSHGSRHAFPDPRGGNGGMWATLPTSLSGLDVIEGPESPPDYGPKSGQGLIRNTVHVFPVEHPESKEEFGVSEPMIRLWSVGGLPAQEPFVWPTAAAIRHWSYRILSEPWQIEAHMATSWSSVVAVTAFPERLQPEGGTKESRLLRSRNRRLLETLKDFSTQPDDLGEAWWEEFRKELQENRLRLRRTTGG
jgi:hypothetical protein